MGNHTISNGAKLYSLENDINYSTELTDRISGYNFLIINDHLPNTGVGKSTFKTFSEMRKIGADITMLLPHQDKEYSFEGVETQLRPKPLRGIKKHGLPFELLSYYYFPRRAPEGYSLYHVFSQMLGRYCAFLDPTVVTCCDSIAFRVEHNHNKFPQHLLKKHFCDIKKSNRIVFVSEHARKDYLDLFDYDPDKTKIIHNGIDRDEFTPGDKTMAREYLDLPQDAVIILNVGSEDPRKNMQTLMRSFERVRRNVDNGLLIRVGAKRDETTSIIYELGLENDVLRTGPVSEEELISYYRAADVLCFPTCYEGFGMPVLEAFATELPVVSSNTTSLPEVAGGAALMTDPMDVEGMASNIEKVLDDNTLRSELIQKGTKRVANFSWENAAKETLELYADVLSK